MDLAGHRLRYAQAKGEAPLQAAHAAFPWLVTLDDHELDNNWAGDSPGLGLDVYRVPALFRRRKAAAFHAMYEHQPMRLAQLPSGPSMHLHRRYRFGDLAEFTMIDTRQYRTPQACGDGSAVIGCAERFDTDRTLLGAAQRDWLVDGFATSTARWQVLGNQVAMAQSDYDPGPDLLLGTDAWDGYVADRNTVLAAAADHAVDNLVVITGDRHENYVADLRRDYADPESPVVATEFTGTSISTGSDGADLTDGARAARRRIRPEILQPPARLCPRRPRSSAVAQRLPRCPVCQPTGRADQHAREFRRREHRPRRDPSVRSDAHAS